MPFLKSRRALRSSRKASRVVSVRVRSGAQCSQPHSALRARTGNEASCRSTRSILRSGWTTANRSEEHTSELQSLMRISYAVFCLKKKKQKQNNNKIDKTK